MLRLRAQDRVIEPLRRLEIAAPMGVESVGEFLGAGHGPAYHSPHLSDKTRRPCPIPCERIGSSEISTIVPQQISACGCHRSEKNFGAILKPRLTRGFSNE